MSSKKIALLDIIKKTDRNIKKILRNKHERRRDNKQLETNYIAKFLNFLRNLRNLF